MSPVRYSLHYEDYSEQLMNRFGKLLQQQTLVDMTLMCTSHTLRVHKAVLAASSAYFEDVLSRSGGEPLVVLKVSFSVLKCLVEFMYGGRTTCAHADLPELLSAATFLSIKGLSRVTREGLGITTQEELPQFTAPVVINQPKTSANLPGFTFPKQESAEPQPSTSQSSLPLTSSSVPGSTSSEHAKHVDAGAGPSLPSHCVSRRQESVARSPYVSTAAEEVAAAGSYVEPQRLGRPRRSRPNFRRGSGWCPPPGVGIWRERSGGGSHATDRSLHRVPQRGARRLPPRLSGVQLSHMQNYMDQMTMQAVDSISGPYPSEGFSPEHCTEPTPSADKLASDGFSSAVSQYVNALKSAGLPTDLPIVFETGDGSYVNVDEQVLLDMVQSNEIQYEVIERPVSLETSVDPAHVKSIDDLSRCLERGQAAAPRPAPPHDFMSDDAGGLSAILPDSAEPYSLPEPTPRSKRTDTSIDLACSDGDLFSGEAMTDDVKKYYEEHFSLSLLPTESGELRKSDCFDFELPMPPGESLDCLMSAAAVGACHTDPDRLHQPSTDRFEDLIKVNNAKTEDTAPEPKNPDVRMEVTREECGEILENSTEINCVANKENVQTPATELPAAGEAPKESNLTLQDGTLDLGETEQPSEAATLDLTESMNAGIEIEKIIDKMKSEERGKLPMLDMVSLTEESELSRERAEDIPYAVGLLPRKQVECDRATRSGRSEAKRPALAELDNLLVDARCLRRKVRKKEN